MSFLQAAEIEGRPLTEEEIDAVISLILAGGLLTTTDAIGNALVYLERNREARRRLIEEPALIQSAIEEFLRYEAPVTGLSRTVSKDCEIDGQKLRKGEKVLMLWASANRDEEEFPNPNEVILDRHPNRHVSFGVGIHRCLGSNFGRLEFRDCARRGPPPYARLHHRAGRDPTIARRGNDLRPAGNSHDVRARAAGSREPRRLMTKPGVLDGLTAVDLTRWFAGALVGMVMADNGARVIRVEPSAASQAAPDPSAGAAGYVQWQRGKEIRELDLKDERGRSEVRSLAERADVLIESFRPGVMERLELGYPELSARNPGLVYCSISGFGPKGRYRRFKGYEGAVAAIAGRHMDMGTFAGAARLCRRSGGELRRLADGSSGRGRGALREGEDRYRTAGRDKPAAGSHRIRHGSWFATQQPSAAPAMNPARGQRRLGAPGYMTAQTRDGRWLQFASLAPHLFWNMVEGLGLGHLRDDPAYARLPAGAAPEVLERFWEQALDAVHAKTYAEWQEILIRQRVGFDLMTTTEEGMDHPQVRHNGHVIQIAHPELGETEQIGPLVRFGQTPSRIPGDAAERGAASPPESREPPPAHALSGVTVLELAAMYAAPFGANLLADLGARVIKLEPLEGDAMRLLGALGIKTIQGKESIAVDLKAPEGQKIVRQLVERADLLMHNYRPGVPERLGIDYPRLRDVNPNLVYLYAAAYGPDGPYAALPAYHPTAGAVAGNAIYQAGEGFPPPPDRELDMEERKDVSARLGRSNEGNPDPNGALVVGTALTLGLLARERHGVGQEMVTTMLCSNAYAMSDDWIRYEWKPARRLVDADLHGPSAL